MAAAHRARRVLLLGGHPVIASVTRLACTAMPDVRVDDGDPSNGVEAMIGSEEPVLVIVDLDRRAGDGLTLLHGVREAGYTGPVLAMSERSDGKRVLDALRAQIQGYVVTPAGLAGLSLDVATLLSGGRAFDGLLDDVAVEELGRRVRVARDRARFTGRLTPREREVLSYLSEGLTLRQIGRRVGLSHRTVETHVGKLYRKLDVRTRVQAVARAANLGLLRVD